MTTSLPKSFTFTKMHGLGNDFVMLAGQDVPTELSLEKDVPALTRFLCDRHRGIGADGLIYDRPPTDPSKFDIQFMYFNSDGSRAEMCGNGIRCFALFVRDRGLITKDSFTVETPAGPIGIQINPDRSVTVDMGPPILAPQDIPFVVQNNGKLDTPVHNYEIPVLEQQVPVTLVSMGNPHCMIFQDDLSQPLDPATFGPAVEAHPYFPNKTNVEFLTVVDEHTLDVTVWERGCGFTQACGTGACASAVAAVIHGKTQPQVSVNLPGGPLQIHWQKDTTNTVLMTGPATYVFEGNVTLPDSL